MAQWIETKLRYGKVMENGAVKKVTEAYLVDALSFTEAEARIIEEMKPRISGDFEVKAVKKAKIAEVFSSESGGYWYKVRAMFISLDEHSGADKLTPPRLYDRGQRHRGSHLGLQERNQPYG